MDEDIWEQIHVPYIKALVISCCQRFTAVQDEQSRPKKRTVFVSLSFLYVILLIEWRDGEMAIVFISSFRRFLSPLYHLNDIDELLFAKYQYNPPM